MHSHGCDVHETHYQFDYSFFAWRYYGDKRSVTLWVSQTVVEDFAANHVVAMLANIDPNALMDSYRNVHVHVTWSDDSFGVHVADTFEPRAA